MGAHSLNGRALLRSLFRIDPTSRWRIAYTPGAYFITRVRVDAFGRKACGGSKGIPVLFGMGEGELTVDEFENQPQQSETSQDTNGTSRRNFLKVAVVSSAAAAAAVGGAGVAATALSSRAPSGLSKLLVLNSNLVSTENACFTNTDFHKVTALNPNESFYVWAWFTLPGGASGQSFTASITAPNPLPSYIAYQGHKQQKVFKNLCSCQDSGHAPSDDAKIKSSDTMPVTFTVPSGTNTVLVQLHLNATSAPAGSVTFTVELTGPSYDVTATTSVVFS